MFIYSCIENSCEYLSGWSERKLEKIPWIVHQEDWHSTILKRELEPINYNRATYFDSIKQEFLLNIFTSRSLPLLGNYIPIPYSGISLNKNNGFMIINGNICKILLNKGLNGKFKSPFHFYNVKFKTSSDWRRMVSG